MLPFSHFAVAALTDAVPSSPERMARNYGSWAKLYPGVSLRQMI